MLVDHPLTMTLSLNILYLPTHPLHPKLKLLVTNISEKTESHEIFQQQRNIYSCPLGVNRPMEDITQCCNSGIIYVGWMAETIYLLPDVNSVLKFFPELYEKGCTAVLL